MKNEKYPQGRKTHEQFRRELERKAGMEEAEQVPHRVLHREERQSEFPVSRRGMNQESEHNKHNHPLKGA
jgi:hypothetical protein